jgi:hypothetical protein
MRISVLIALAGFGVAITPAAATAQQGQHQQHQPPAAPPGKESPAPANPMRDMMADPARHQQMMERMTQCRDMMSMMIEYMRHAPANPAPAPPPR